MGEILCQCCFSYSEELYLWHHIYKIRSIVIWTLTIENIFCQSWLSYSTQAHNFYALEISTPLPSIWKVKFFSLWCCFRKVINPGEWRPRSRYIILGIPAVEVSAAIANWKIETEMERDGKLKGDRWNSERADRWIFRSREILGKIAMPNPSHYALIQ